MKFYCYMQFPPVMLAGEYQPRLVRIRNLVIEAADGSEALQQAKSRGFVRNPIVEEIRNEI